MIQIRLGLSSKQAIAILNSISITRTTTKSSIVFLRRTRGLGLQGAAFARLFVRYSLPRREADQATSANMISEKQLFGLRSTSP